jgi:uncharacterized protein YihD (DUF1040 family)
MIEKSSELSETENMIVDNINDPFNLDFERVTFESLAKNVAEHGFEDHLEEITREILKSKLTSRNMKVKRTVQDWSVRDCCDWIMTLKFLRPSNQLISQAFEMECVNGIAMIDYSLITKWTELRLDLGHFLMLRYDMDFNGISN